MSDLISRQAAIDVINHELRCGAVIDQCGLETAHDLIKELPSAETEQKWIPCSERLPEETGTYMTTIDYGYYGLVTGQRYYHGGALGWEDECVIAWMPMPTPYKEENR